MSMRIFVVDTNVVAAGLLTTNPDSPTARVLNAMLDGSLFFLLSPELLREYRGVLLRPRLVRGHGLNEAEIEHILAEITANAIWRTPPPDKTHTAPDPEDTHLWALLASEPGAVLITGDHLLIENPRPASAVIPPATWIECLSS